MSTKYKATMPDKGYFITITTVGWVDVFTRLNPDSADLFLKSKLSKSQAIPRSPKSD